MVHKLTYHHHHGGVHHLAVTFRVRGSKEPRGRRSRSSFRVGHQVDSNSSWRFREGSAVTRRSGEAMRIWWEDDISMDNLWIIQWIIQWVDVSWGNLNQKPEVFPWNMGLSCEIWDFPMKIMGFFGVKFVPEKPINWMGIRGSTLRWCGMLWNDPPFWMGKSWKIHDFDWAIW